MRHPPIVVQQTLTSPPRGFRPLTEQLLHSSAIAWKPRGYQLGGCPDEWKMLIGRRRGRTPTDGSQPGVKPNASAGSAPRIVHGDPITFKFGIVQADVTITGSTITDINTVQAPGGGYQAYTDRAIPGMKQRIMAAQSTNVAAVSGATYTSNGYAQSVQSALNKA